MSRDEPRCVSVMSNVADLPQQGPFGGFRGGSTEIAATKVTMAPVHPACAETL
jgi:hypothetical protein